MKKAFIDQILLGLFLFVALIGLGATISDNMQARDKYYNLKKVTDNAVLTLAKYYVKIEESTFNAEAVHQDMLLETKLGQEIKDTIVYSWDFVSEPNTVTATISNYQEDTFWLKFLDLDFLTLNVESRATITSVDLPTPTSDYSAGLAPFAINDRTFNIGDAIEMNYSLTADWEYSDKDTFYPVITDCDCDCSFALSNKFDFSDLGFDVDSCDSSLPGCSTSGQSEFSHYSNMLSDIYDSSQSINFENGKTETPICLLGTYLGNDYSTWVTQINHLSDGIFDIIGPSGANLPIEMDIITLNSGAIANGIVRVRVTDYEIVDNGTPSNRSIKLITEVVPAKTPEIELVY